MTAPRTDEGAMSGADPGSIERRFPRRLLIAGAATAAAVGVVESVAGGAEAAAPTATWLCGGNSNINRNGSNFVGPTNVAPLVFKTAATSGKPVERMRITPPGLVGINTPSPRAQLHVRSSDGVTIRAATNSTDAASRSVLASATKGAAVEAKSVDGAGITTSSTNATGVDSIGGYAGVRGTAGSYGGIFSASSGSGVGVYGSGSAYGTYGSGSIGVYGTGVTNGVYGSGVTNGVYGSGATGVTGAGSVTGVKGTTTNPNGAAVWGSGGQYGVRGDLGRTGGVYGESGYVGVWAQAPSYGVFALATDTSGAQTYGVFCQASNGASFALYAQGRAHINGTLSKSAGSFMIDHPLAPDDKWLSHSFVESPDMMNVYNGNVVLDEDGSATVELPVYFEALNRDFRYQLTPIGAPAQLYVSAEVEGNAFSIAGGSPGLKVSWQVTGIRQDDYAREHPIVVETDKPADEVGSRQFVAAGSGARQMHNTPRAAGPMAGATHDATPEQVHPRTLGDD